MIKILSSHGVKIRSSHGPGNVNVPGSYNMRVNPLDPLIQATVLRRLNKHVSNQLEWNIDYEKGQNQSWIIIQMLDFSGNIIAEERINSLRVANVKIDSYMIEWLVEQGKQLFAKSGWTKQGTRQEKKMKKKGKQKVYSSVSPDIFNKAKKHFGTTNNILEAGYILPDGSLLDFSGKRDGGKSGRRTVDHREIDEIFDSLEGTDAMIAFMAAGAVRLAPNIQGMDIIKPLTPQQTQAVRGFANRFNGEVTLEISETNGVVKYSREFPARTASEAVINEIKRSFGKQSSVHSSVLSENIFQRLDKNRFENPDDEDFNIRSFLKVVPKDIEQDIDNFLERNDIATCQDCTNHGIWQQLPMQLIDPKKLYTVQETLCDEDIERMVEDFEEQRRPIWVVDYNGKLVVQDGNHRATMAFLMGKPVKAKVLKYEQEPK
jgi:hypothetical protein